MESLRRVLRLVKKNGFLVGLYLTFFWLRVLDIITGDGVADQLVWSVLWLTPMVYIEPTVRKTLVTDYWMRNSMLWSFEVGVMVALSMYLCFIKFVVYGQLITMLDVVLLVCLSIFYHMLEVIRRLSEVDYTMILAGLSFFFAVLLKTIVFVL